MSGISVDIDNELKAIAREACLLTNSLQLVAADLVQSPDSARAWLYTQGVASGIVKIYSGCEKVLARLAATLDRAPVDTSAGWHATLLRRAANPYPGLRGAIISQTCYDALNRFRAFRHRERSSYGVDLDLSIVIDAATRCSRRSACSSPKFARS